ncbi:MAG: Rieske 2Fe-2S domain-containing protein [Myxococcota bacterium]
MLADHAFHDAIGTTYARGWYLVQWSEALAPGEIQPLRYFGHDFVLYRSEAGDARLLDAHCPHLGAHLGHGGRVEGDSIVCPFHAWRFDGAGACTEVPYAKRIPAKAALHAYELREHSGMILAYLDAPGRTPEYEVPPIVEHGDPGWTELVVSEMEIATQAREVIENIADRAHFSHVHDTNIHAFDVDVDGPRATQKSTVGRFIRGQEWLGESSATYYGPAVQFTTIVWTHPTVLINAHVPIDEHRLLLRFAVLMKKPEGVEVPRSAIQVHINAMSEGYLQDVAIWENKRWQDQPILADGDGPIGTIRRWYASFFDERA